MKRKKLFGQPNARSGDKKYLHSIVFVEVFMMDICGAFTTWVSDYCANFCQRIDYESRI